MIKDGALSGVRVLDLGLLVQGPHAGQLLSDLGADVIKVEMPDVGDYSRWIPASPTDRRPPFFISCNRGKRSLAIDLRKERGAKLFLELCDRADVVISNFSPGTMERWGLGYEELAARNPKLIYAAASTFGDRTDPGFERGVDLSGQALGGLISVTGPEGSAGVPAGVAVADHLGSLNLTIGILAALIFRESSGAGQSVSTSLVGSLLMAQGPELMSYFLSGDLPAPSGSGHHILRSLYGVFKTSDGGIAITHVPETKRGAFWYAVGLPQMSGAAELNGVLTKKSKSEVHRMLNAALGGETTDFWCRLFTKLGVDYAPVRNYRDIEEDPISFINGYLQKVNYPKWGEITVPGSAIDLSASPLLPGKLPPRLGEHSAEILKEYLGLADAEIASLHSAGVI